MTCPPPNVPAGRWATPTTGASASTTPVPDSAADIPVVPRDLQSAATEATAKAQAVQQLVLAAPAAADSCEGHGTPIEVQTEAGGGMKPATLPRLQSPPPTAERWQLGDAEELQPASPVVTPAQHAPWAQGSPEVFSTPTAELQPPSPGDEDPDSHNGGSPAEDSLQPVPFGLDSPLAGHVNGVSGDSAISPAAASTDVAGTDTASNACLEGAASPGMLRISPLPDCRGGVPQRV